MLTFAEEILLLLLEDEQGKFLPVTRHALGHALVGAVLMDLAFANRIDTDLERLTVTDATPTHNPMLDEVLERIVSSRKARSAVDWLKALSGEEAANIREQALASLVERGIVERRDTKVLGFFRSRRYPPVDGERMRSASLRISELLSSDQIPDPRDVALVSLADACGVLRTAFEEAEIERNMPRLRQLGKMDLIGREMLGRISVWKHGLTGPDDD
ncbi:MAG: GPP34 family phosphoprotein [Gammaproteobacteria bacterium]|nr:GPP34 family phosphoprotein [Gammaproteobacteria bacterium]MDE0366860.1 GPP34 family phosphoprotein [Gammaproteobacteria bacterium]